LTRLLYPEAFGLMSLVAAIMYGLEMLSDTGVGPAITRDKRGEDPDFLNTGWTIQVIRGVLLWLISCLIALPVAHFYGLPELAQLIPAVGLTTVLGGFSSTAFHTCRRRMEFGRLTVLEVSNEALGLLVTVVLTLIHPTVWALVGGWLVSRLFVTLASHVYLPGIRNRFRWEPTSVDVLIGFGKWIFLSSAFHFLAIQGDRMLLGHFLNMTQFGVYSIAVVLSEVLQSLATKIVRNVLFPAYSIVARDEAHRLRSVSYRARLAIDVTLVLPVAALIFLGGWVVQLLYDARYQEAGWIFQVLCVRVLMAATLTNSESCLVAMGHPQYGFTQSAGRAIWILCSIPICWHLMGIEGVVWAVALSELPVMVVLWIGMIRHHVFSLSCEIRSLLFACLGMLIGYGLLRIMP